MTNFFSRERKTFEDTLVDLNEQLRYKEYVENFIEVQQVNISVYFISDHLNLNFLLGKFGVGI